MQARWAHYVAFVVASLAILHLLLFLGTAYLFVDAHHWVLISVAVLATLGGFVLALRVRRVAHVVPVLLLCATGAVIAQGFWWL
jgi:hypothetical protein